MNNTDMISLIPEEIKIQIEKIIHATIIDNSLPEQGMDNQVIQITDQSGKEYMIKIGEEVMNDVRALELIQEHAIHISVPKIFGYFINQSCVVLILEKIQFPLLKSVPIESFHWYIDSMLEQLQTLHLITLDKPGLLVAPEDNKSWKELLLFRYSGKHPWFDWESIANRKGVQKEIVLYAVRRIYQLIQHSDFPQKTNSLLHTDFNQRNLFVNPKTRTISGIIDWTEAMFGDPLYDFARVRLFIWHFDLQNHAKENYFHHLQLTDEEKIREQIYFLSLMLDYITWYSEIKNEFNDARLKLHQQFLKDYKW